MNDEEIETKNLFNLVLFELEKYCSNVANHPRVNDDIHYAELRTKRAPLSRAVHWYLCDNGLVYQSWGPRMDVSRDEYANLWKLKPFDKKEVCQHILQKYGDYLNLFIKDFEDAQFSVECGLEQVLREKGIGKELDENFGSICRKYQDDAELSASEYNKYLIKKYAEIVFNN